MTVHRSELRAYPRLSCALPARFLLEDGSGDLCGEGQVMDLSPGGCKLLPAQLGPLVDRNVACGTPVTVRLNGAVVEGIIAWTTPNFSAIGCRFDAVLAETGVLVPMMAAE
ncbi:MAG: PilZ domain-containing protein [Magnetospirillum sp.]|nr:PilZ domain-containing protein [Magnetospirillum sp.]